MSEEAQFAKWAGQLGGCGDSSCLIEKPEKPTGHHGACHCKPSILKTVMGRMKTEWSLMREEIEQLKDAAESRRDEINTLRGKVHRMSLNLSQMDLGL